MPAVDIIVRAKNGHELTQKCVESIRENTDPGAYRLILVDDGSEFPSTLPCDVRIRHSEPRGAVSATNSGLGIALGFQDSDYVLILDNDTRIPDGDSLWLTRFIAELEAGGPKTACVGATCGYANRPQHILAVPQTYTGDWKRNEKEQGTKANPAVIWFISFAVLFRKSVLRELGFWDERYDPGNWEDTDYSVLVRQAGYEIRVARSVYIHHEGSQTFAGQLNELMVTNQGKFVEKWGQGRLWDMGFFSNAEVFQGLTDLFHGQQQQVRRPEGA